MNRDPKSQGPQDAHGLPCDFNCPSSRKALMAIEFAVKLGQPVDLNAVVVEAHNFLLGLDINETVNVTRESTDDI